jgi:DNA-binding transcriptional ArsR family regulator
MRVFRAIADPTRRAMLDRLAAGECAAGDLAACGARRMSQPALSQHLAVLRRADLVSDRRDGRRRLYRLHAEPLRQIHDWLDHYRAFWDTRLDALGQYLDHQAAAAGAGVDRPAPRAPSDRAPDEAPDEDHLLARVVARLPGRRS